MRYLTILTAFILISCSDNVNSELKDMEQTFIAFENEWNKCQGTKNCAEIPLKLATYVNHPDNQTLLELCAEEGDCYDAMTNVTNNLLLNIDRLLPGLKDFEDNSDELLKQYLD